MLKDKTLKELLEDERISEIAPDAISNWDLSKEDVYNLTLEEITAKHGWPGLEEGFSRLFEMADRGEYCYRLYTENECADAPNKKNTNIVYFPSDDETAQKRPFIFLVPGGGFVNVWNLTEGWPLAQIFNGLGYNVFILTYQVGVHAAAVKAMDDMARAFEIISSNRDRFRVDPDNYITCGFSAGGYVICLWNTEKGYASFGIKKPRACFPIYPVTSNRILAAEDDWDDKEKEEFAWNTLGCSMEEACNGPYEIPEHVEGFPPTAIFLAKEDELVDPEHSKRLALALSKAGIACRIEIGPTGGHGFANGDGMCMEGWPGRAIEWYESLK